MPVYKVSSTVKVEQMEADLSEQLSALRREIEKNCFHLHEEPCKTYSSVQPPKDISFFRLEREQVLKRGLQVAEALPVLSQASIMQKELESSLDMEYTPECLPLLLHQFYSDRSSHLAQMKYALMLRWTRFFRHTTVIQELFPHYKEQVAYLMSEYEDAGQRARRLAVSRDRILTGQGSPISAVTQEDVVIYLRWLVTHLHSVKILHNFFRVLHYLPACTRKDNDSLQKVFVRDHKEGLDEHGLAGNIPIHTIELEEYRNELTSLLSDFHLSHSTHNIQTTADEMELFSVVSREFKSIFRKQQDMKTFSQYEGSEVKCNQSGRKSAGMALRKDSNWIPFIQVKPQRDPWQQKLITKLKEKNCVDELLRMHSKFLQVSDVSQVGVALREHAAQLCKCGARRPPSVTSDNRRTKPLKASEIWASIYNATNVSHETNDDMLKLKVKERKGDKPLKSNTSHTSGKHERFMASLQLLGLDDDQEDIISDPITTRGAYLSLVYLRHLKIRQLQRITLGMLNYLRSVERTLTFDLAGLRLQGTELCSTLEETCWMNVARGGRGTAGGLGSLHYTHNTPVDYKVHCSEFMEFADVENLHDFYTNEERLIHTQDQWGFHIVYDIALQDLSELENELALVGSHYIRRKEKEAPLSSRAPASGSGTHVDRVKVLLDLWTCETQFLESKVQLLNCYYEAYQHVLGLEERFALAQVITDIMHRRPRIDLSKDYFMLAYRAEIACLQSHQNLIRVILDHQIDWQRQYLQRIWRVGQCGSIHTYGLPPNYVPKHPVSLGGSSPALMNVFLLEMHPSLELASMVYWSLSQAHTELCSLQGPRGVTEDVMLEQRLLQQALQNWSTLASPGAFYSSNIQKDLFSEVFIEDPALVQAVGLSLITSAAESDVKQGGEKHVHALETLCWLLELVIVRHRLLESASETAHLAQLYKALAAELGFADFHLHMRPVPFDLAVVKHTAEQGSVFITALQPDSSCVDRYAPSSLPLSIQELDEKHIGRFSFSCEESVVNLLNRLSLENLHVTLACQITQKNALISALKQACLCYWADDGTVPVEGQGSIQADGNNNSSTCLPCNLGRNTDSLQQKSNRLSSEGLKKHARGRNERLVESFVSVQLEKAGLRDEMLDSFVKRKQETKDLKHNPENAGKIERSLITDFCKNFTTRMSQYCVRAQIVAHYYSLSSLLDHVPCIRQSHFMAGQDSHPEPCADAHPSPDPRTFQRRPSCLVSEDGTTLLNLWYIPHFTEVLCMFRTQNTSACSKALQHTLEIASALRDIVFYLVSFARLGNTGDSSRSDRGLEELSADWGGTEHIGAELVDIQSQVDRLTDPSSPEAVGRLLQLHKEVLFLRFDTAIRHLIREAFLSSGDLESYHTVSDSMGRALPLLSDVMRSDVHSVMAVPPPLDAAGYQDHRMYPWRCFMARYGLCPVRVWDVPPIEYCMQVCVSGLSSRSRLQANAAILGVSILVEDVLNSGQEAEPFRLHDNKKGEPAGLEAEGRSVSKAPIPLTEPMKVQSALKGFLLLAKQLQVFKESWARRRLGAQVLSSPTLYEQFVKLYRDDIFYPSMRALAQHMGTERDYETMVTSRQSLLPPPGASEVDVKAWQLHRLLESTECEMLRDVQRKTSRDLTLAISERARQETGLPTELWKKAPLKYSVSLERPQIVEDFVQQLMTAAEENDEQLSFPKAHVHRCLIKLGCCVVERERRSFLFYSHFYEQILQQQTLLLHKQEQDLKNAEYSQNQISYPVNEVATQCRRMMLEISGLQAHIAHLEEENSSLEEQLGLKYKQRYDSLVRQLFATTIKLKARLDEYHVQMEQDVCQMVSRVQREGMDKMTTLKQKYGNITTEDDLTLTQMKNENISELHQENCQLTILLCKMKALFHWRQVVCQEKLQNKLLQSQQREIVCRREALRVKMTCEEEVVVLQEELHATKQAVAHFQEKHSHNEVLLHKQTEELKAARQRFVQELRSRQDVDSQRAQSLELLRLETESRERQRRALEEQLDRGSKESQLHRQRSAKEIHQVRSQLHQERSLKHEAYQQVDKLQSQVNNIETALSRCPSASALSKTFPLNRLSGRNPSAGLPRARQLSAVHVSSNIKVPMPEDLCTQASRQKADCTRSRSNTTLDRPKADPSRLQGPTSEDKADLCDESFSCITTQVQRLKPTYW